MKVAIVHDTVERWSGSSKFLWELLQILPGSDLYTLTFDGGEPKNLEISKLVKRLIVGWLGKLSWLPYFRTILLFYAPYFWESLDLSDYDLVISSTHGYGSYGVIVPTGIPHLCYCHTPSKRMYGERGLTAMRDRRFKSFSGSWLFTKRRLWDYVAAQRPDVWWVNSEYTRVRVKRCLGRDSEVVYVPLRSYEINKGEEVKEYYLYFGRLVLDKGLELIIRAFNKNRQRLVIVGAGRKSDVLYLRSLAGRGIEFLGFVEDEALPEIFARARACVFAARGEDFGMVMAEVLSAGVPVIAYAAGGAKEIVEDGQSGVLFKEYTEKSLNEAILRLKGLNITEESCKKRAFCFQKSGLRERLRLWLEENTIKSRG